MTLTTKKSVKTTNKDASFSQYRRFSPPSHRLRRDIPTNLPPTLPTCLNPLVQVGGDDEREEALKRQNAI